MGQDRRDLRVHRDLEVRIRQKLSLYISIVFEVKFSMPKGLVDIITRLGEVER